MSNEVVAALLGAAVGAVLTFLASWSLFGLEARRRRREQRQVAAIALQTTLAAMVDVVAERRGMDQARAAAHRATLQFATLKVGLGGKDAEALDLWWMDVHEHYLAIVESQDETRAAIDQARSVSLLASRKLIAWTSGSATIADMQLPLDAWSAKDKNLF